MPKTLILLFHPRFAHSKANRALCAAAATVPGVEIADLYACYPDGAIDVDAEVRRLRDADRIVFQFPVQWYAMPALLKAWQDAVLTRMFYLAYDTEGRTLEGKPLLVAATAGNVPQAYTPAGVNLFPLAELLRPLQATAHRCGLPWTEPFLLFEAGKLGSDALAAAGERYAARLGQWDVGCGTDAPSRCRAA